MERLKMRDNVISMINLVQRERVVLDFRISANLTRYGLEISQIGSCTQLLVPVTG